MNDDTGEQPADGSSARSSSSRSEFACIEAIRKRCNSNTQHGGIEIGVGDDAAVVRVTQGKGLVITTDLLVEDIDFRRHSTSPFLLGHKALAVSLSDIAAMGARPRYSLLSIGIPADVWETKFVD